MASRALSIFLLVVVACAAVAQIETAETLAKWATEIAKYQKEMEIESPPPPPNFGVMASGQNSFCDLFTASGQLITRVTLYLGSAFPDTCSTYTVGDPVTADNFCASVRAIYPGVYGYLLNNCGNECCSNPAAMQCESAAKQVGCATYACNNPTQSPAIGGLPDTGCGTPCPYEPTVCGDPHLKGFNGHTYAFCEDNDGAECKGKTFNMLTSSAYQLNTKVDRQAGPNAWPHAGTWMTGFGMRYADVLSFEVAMNSNTEFEVETDPTRPMGTRSTAVKGGFKKILSTLRLNGKDMMAELESGHTLEMGDAIVFFPSTKHAHDGISGPVAIVRTPEMEVAFFLEAGDMWHMDVQVQLLGRGLQMHGILGQSLKWRRQAEAKVEGADLDYVIASNDLLGTEFKYNLFTGKRSEAGYPRALLGFEAANGKTAGGPVTDIVA